MGWHVESELAWLRGSSADILVVKSEAQLAIGLKLGSAKTGCHLNIWPLTNLQRQIVTDTLNRFVRYIIFAGVLPLESQACLR